MYINCVVFIVVGFRWVLVRRIRLYFNCTFAQLYPFLERLYRIRKVSVSIYVLLCNALRLSKKKRVYESWVPHSNNKSKTKELTMKYCTTNYVKWTRPTYFLFLQFGVWDDMVHLAKLVKTFIYSHNLCSIYFFRI